MDKNMKMTHTENALIAQMVQDAIMNDPRVATGSGESSVFRRARAWYDRALTLKSKNRFHYSSVVDKTFEEFLCEHESNLGVLDFWDGDIVDDVSIDSSGEEKVRTGIVEFIQVNPTIHGGGHAKVLFPDGGEANIVWKRLRHSKIPQKLVDLAKTQLLATHVCPLAGGGRDESGKWGVVE